MEPLILIADDAMFMRKVIKKILTDGGYTRIREASDGLKALEEYRSERPDLMLLDITMPGMQGTEVLGEIMKEDPDAKIVMCSAIGQDAIVADAIRKGAYDFIIKPFDADKILKMVKSALEQTEKRRGKD